MNRFPKNLILFFSIIVLLGTSSFAKPPFKDNHKKFKKEKRIPYGLQKKLQRGGELPPGWQKKLKVGSFVSPHVLSKGRILDYKDFSKYPKPTNSELYKIEDKIIKINRVTNVILDVLK